VCGRKKLPFAGYSVVKDLTMKLSAASFRLPAINERRLRDELLSNFCRLRFLQLEAGSRKPEADGGEYRARTGDLLVANQALSQLS
jgi:hypothetical protein